MTTLSKLNSRNIKIIIKKQKGRAIIPQNWYNSNLDPCMYVCVYLEEERGGSEIHKNENILFMCVYLCRCILRFA